MVEQAGRRERKKRDTRTRIQDAALELFAAQGFRETTVAAIAEHADVATRTVALHFPAKEDLLFADEPFRVHSLAQVLAERGAGRSTLDAVRVWMAATMHDLDTQDDGGDAGKVWWRRAVRARLLVEDDDLRGRARAGYRDLEQLVADGVGRDIGLPADALVPRLAATTVVVGLREIYATHEAQAVARLAMADLMPLVDRVLDFARAGIRACAPPPEPSDP
jgi:AcrR family transcriptional regulator